MSAAAAALPFHNGTASTGARPPSSGANGGGERHFEHIDDLKAKADQGYDRNSSISRLLEDAERGLNQAKSMNEFRRPDMAFVEYLRATEIITNVIPRHRDKVDFEVGHPEGWQKYRVLVKRVHGMSEQYSNIKAIIVNNNQRHGTRPKSLTGATASAPAPQYQAGNQAVNGSHAAAVAAGSQKVRPAPSPKPDKLHGRALSTAAAGMSGDALNDRFARLRTTPLDNLSRTDSNASNVSSFQGSPVSMASTDYPNGRASFDSLHLTNSLSGRPQGPRGMPNGGPPVPAKLNTNIAVIMPQEPKATYSPARNMQTIGNIAPPRHSARSLASNPVRRPSTMGSSASATAPNGLVQSNDYFPTTAADAIVPPQALKRQAMHVPSESRFSPRKLYDYLERYSILVIDVRSRQDFDQGHIYTRSVICIEPVSITQGMSAEQLLESMVVSPDIEQDMFHNRDKYDLVVYYDAQTASEGFLERPANSSEQKLKWLHESLFDFNQDRPLHRPPILLVGGIAGWVDLIGSQALVTSDTLGKVKQGRPLQRRPLATAAVNGHGQLRVPKRRVREYNPLDAEEEKSWRERARAESVVLPQDTVLEQDDLESGDGAILEEDDQAGSAIDDFNARFPDAGSLDRYAFVGVKPSRPPPEIPAKVPLYPAAPPPSQYPSQYPSAPARPQPAAPRMSYTGVSDRAVSASTPTPRIVSGAPYVPQKYQATNFRLPKVGLTNFGNTCYMNSTVQALLATTSLSQYFLEDGFKLSIQRDNWRSNSKGVMAELYSNLIRNLWKNDCNFLRPTTFRRFCGRALQRFESDGEQQDAKDFLDFLLDCLHEDLNVNWNKEPLHPLTEQQEATRERMPKLVIAKMEWARHLHRDFSYVNNLLGGQHLSKLTCTTCHFTSSKYEFFSSISVEIPTDPRKYHNGRFCTLEDCLRSYCTEELLNKDEMWNCPRCKTQREATKRITITRVPQFLIVHFKRFASFGSSARKVRIPVDFPLEGLDLAPYALPPPGPEEAQLIARDYGVEHLKYEEAMTPPYVYDAYAVVRHIGQTMQSGHYVTAAKDRARKKWRWFNDTRVTDFEPEDLRGKDGLQNEEAYIVFYQRRMER